MEYAFMTESITKMLPLHMTMHEPILEKGEYTQREVLSQVSQPESWPVAGLCFD